MISRIVKWYLLINKRLFRKYSFILLLGIVPLFVTGIRVFSMEESGIVRIVLCQKDPKDELAAHASQSDNNSFAYPLLRYPSLI